MNRTLSKRYPTPEDKEEATSRGRRGITQYKQPHTSQVGSPTDWKVTGSQRLPYRNESSEPHIKSPHLGIWHWEKEPLEHLALKARGLVRSRSTGLGETETPFLKGTHRLSRALGPRAERGLHRNLGQT